jgi:hypothetical protein
MHLLVAQAEGHSALEKASWVVTIIAFGLGVLQLLIYWFGRNFPLQVRAKGHVTRMSEGQQIIRVVVEFRSRTRDTQTVREILLFDPPNVVWRALRPWWYRKDWSATPSTIQRPPLPLTVDGHDTQEVLVAFPGGQLPYGDRTRLKVRASRRRPYVARVRLKSGVTDRMAGASAGGSREIGARPGECGHPGEQQPRRAAIGPAAALDAEAAVTTPTPNAGDKRVEESEPNVREKAGPRGWTRALTVRVPDPIRKYAPAAALGVLVGLSAFAGAVFTRLRRRGS